MSKIRRYYEAIKKQTEPTMLVATKVWCCFCGAGNTVTFDLSAAMINFKANCYQCEKDFCYDVELRFFTESFDPAKLRAVPHNLRSENSSPMG